MPYFIVLQSNEFSSQITRLVIPLLLGADAYPANFPRFVIDGQSLVADALLMFAIPCSRLADVVASFADDINAFTLIGAIDRAIGQGYR